MVVSEFGEKKSRNAKESELAQRHCNHILLAKQISSLAWNKGMGK